MSRKEQAKKLLGAVSEGQHTTEGKETPGKLCVNCLTKLTDITLCEECGSYCSRKCLKDHVYHKQYCAAICSLKKIESEKRMKNEICVSDGEKLPFKMKMKLIRLVGERPLVNIFLNNRELEGLWDTGSMISLINKYFLEDHFPAVEMYSVADFMEHNSLKLTTANQTELCVDGVVVLNFGIENDHKLFQVPFLVMMEPFSKPIIGYNTIEHFVTVFENKIDLSSSLMKVVKGLSTENADTMVNISAGGKISETVRDAKSVNGWINRSHSAYSSPMVCVRKKDGDYVCALTLGN